MLRESEVKPEVKLDSKGRPGKDVAVDLGGYTIDVSPDAQGSAMAFFFCRGPAYCWRFLVTMLTCCGCYLWTTLESALCGGCCFTRCKPKPSPLSESQILATFTETYPFTELVTVPDPSRPDDWVVDTRGVSVVTQTNGEPLVGVLAIWRSNVLSEMLVGTSRLARGEHIGTSLWQSATVHLMSSAAYLVKFSYHPQTHFMQSVIIKAMQSWFPDTTSAVRQLFDVHTEFAQQINYDVLFTKDSVLQGPESFWCWNVQPTTIQEIVKIFPVMKKPYKPGVAPTLRATYQPVYDVIVRFVTSVVDFEKRRLGSNWADPAPMMAWLKQYLGDGIGDDFTGFLADLVWKLAIDHGIQHENFGAWTVTGAPMDIVASPFYRQPKNQTTGIVRLGLTSLMKSFVYHDEFDMWTDNRCCHDSRTVKVQYPFEETNTDLRRAAMTFRLGLRNTIPESMQNHLAKSIEF